MHPILTGRVSLKKSFKFDSKPAGFPVDMWDANGIGKLPTITSPRPFSKLKHVRNPT